MMQSSTTVFKHFNIDAIICAKWVIGSPEDESSNMYYLNY